MRTGCMPWVCGVHGGGVRDASHGFAGCTPWVCGVHTMGTPLESNSANVTCNDSEATERPDTRDEGLTKHTVSS